MIRDVTLLKRTAAPQSTVDRIKKMKEVADKVWRARYMPGQEETKLEDIPF